MRVIPPVVRNPAAVAGDRSAQPIGRVRALVGAAFIERNGQRLPARPGLPLQAGDTLVTGRNGRIGVTFADGSRFAAAPNQRIVLPGSEFSPHRDEFITAKDRGSLREVSRQLYRPNGDEMRVRTPTSMLGGARG